MVDGAHYTALFCSHIRGECFAAQDKTYLVDEGFGVARVCAAGPQEGELGLKAWVLGYVDV